MSEGRLVEAEAALDGIPTSSDALIAQRDALRAELSVRFHDAVEARALQAIDELDVEVARKLIPELPPERRAPLEKELARLEARVVSLEQQRAARQRQAAAAAKRSRARREQARIASVLRPIERKFEARSFDRAVLECDRVIDSNRGDRAVQARAQELKRLIPAFMRAWDDGNRKVQAHALESALAPLRRARELYGEIGFDGALGEQLDAQILESLLASARSAVARGDLGQAGALYREARKVDPSDRRPSAGLRQLSDRAEELYYEAYNDRHRDPRRAIAKMRLVMDLAEKGSPAWSKAKAQLAELQP